MKKSDISVSQFFVYSLMAFLPAFAFAFYIYFLRTPFFAEPVSGPFRYSLWHNVWQMLIGNILSAGALIFVLSLFWKCRQSLKEFLKDLPFYIPFIVFTIPFLISRLWFFIDSPVPGIFPDSGSYISVAESLGFSSLPDLSIRPPAYPFFLKLFYCSSGTLLLVFMQNLLSYLSCLMLIYSVFVLNRILAPFAAFALAGFCCGLWHLTYDTSLLSENLYTSLIILFFSFLFLGLKKRHYAYFLISSLLCAGILLTKPAGIYLAVTCVIIIAFMIWNRFSASGILSFAIPFPLLVILFCLYNYFTAGVFSITAFGEANLAVATVTMWEEDDSYPEFINRHIRDVKGELFSKDDLSTIKDSFNPVKLALVYEKGFSGRVREVPAADYNEVRKHLKSLSIDAILKNPLKYLKYFSTMFTLYWGNILREGDLILMLRQRAKWLYDPNSKYYNLYLEFYPYHNSLNTPSRFCGLNKWTLPRFLYQVLLCLHQAVFVNFLWPFVYFGIMIFSAVKLYVEKFRHTGTFIVFIFTVTALGASLIVCMAEYALARYSYVMNFVIYLSPVLYPLLFIRLDKAGEKEAET